MVEKNCNLCDLERDSFTHYEKLCRPDIDRFSVMQSDNFLVKPDVLPATETGFHLLIYPRFHTITHSKIEGLDFEMNKVLFELEEKFGKFAIMEHGDVDNSNVSLMSVRHAHAHIFNDTGDSDLVEYMGDELKRQGVDCGVVERPNYSYLKSLRRFFINKPYLYVQQGGKALYVVENNGNVKSQTIQKKMHRWFNRGSEFDWKEIDKNDEFAKLSTRRISNLIEKCNEK